MKYKFKLILLFSFFASVFLTSFLPSDKNEPSENKQVPFYSSIENLIQDQNLSTKDYSKIILNFWDPLDASSRIRLNFLNNICERDNNIILLNIGSSSDTLLEQEIIRNDIGNSVSSNTIYLSSEKFSNDFLKYFDVKGGNRYFVMDSYGVIISIMPEKEELMELLLKA